MRFDESNPKRMKAAIKAGRVTEPTRRFANQDIPPSKTYELLDYYEFNHGGDRTFLFDVESYPNYFQVGFKCDRTNKIVYFEDMEEGFFINGYEVNQEQFTSQLAYAMFRFTIVGFNSRNYDVPILMVATQGVRAPMLNQITDEIINQDLQPYQVERKYCGRMPTINHIDLIETAPLHGSLKLYAGRLHCERMQDLPFAPMTYLTNWQKVVVRDYNINDLDNTHLLWKELKPQIDLRVELGKEYGVDLRSKSDAQLAEAVIVSELEKLGVNPKAPDIEQGTEFFYQVPDFISFKSKQFQDALEVVRTHPFIVGAGGYADCPKEIEKLKPRLGNATYKLGAGGLHSSEETVAYEADENTLLIDRDVARYYPSIILNCELAPKHLGAPFLKVYQGIVNKRDAAKVLKDKVTDQTMKIVINGSFGKLGNNYSAFYSPDLLIQVTMTGQLSLMMLIEAVELADIPVVSANTDGIVIRCPKDRYKDLETVVILWEELTGFITEETRYRGLYCRDVNNYIAVKLDGSCKTKGTYSKVGSALNSMLSKNPDAYITSMAVQAYLLDGTPLADTIENNLDIRNFLCVRNVKGGAEKDGVYLGKTVRWYYAKDETGNIGYVLTGNKVPKSEGAKPCMILPAQFPVDIDFDRYINDAEQILYDIGVLRKATTGSLL